MKKIEEVIDFLESKKKLYSQMDESNRKDYVMECLDTAIMALEYMYEDWEEFEAYCKRKEKRERMSKGLVDKLLETGKDLVIGKDIKDNITVCFEDGYIKDGNFLIGSCGRGKTFEEAVTDYCRQISGKTLVFDYPNRRETIKILI